METPELWDTERDDRERNEADVDDEHREDENPSDDREAEGDDVAEEEDQGAPAREAQLLHFVLATVGALQF